MFESYLYLNFAEPHHGKFNFAEAINDKFSVRRLKQTAGSSSSSRINKILPFQYCPLNFHVLLFASLSGFLSLALVVGKVLPTLHTSRTINYKPPTHGSCPRLSIRALLLHSQNSVREDEIGNVIKRWLYFQAKRAALESLPDVNTNCCVVDPRPGY